MQQAAEIIIDKRSYNNVCACNNSLVLYDINNIKCDQKIGIKFSNERK